MKPASRRSRAFEAAAVLLAAATVPLTPAAVRAQGEAGVQGEASVHATSGADSSFRAFLPAFEAATRAMLDGDAAPWLRLLSAEPGGTLFTPFGQVEAGRPALEARYRVAAARHAPGPARLEVEYLTIEVSGGVAYVVALERSRFRPVGSDSLRSGYTRATMIFRRENGGWRLRHRHMDHLEAEAQPASGGRLRARRSVRLRDTFPERA